MTPEEELIILEMAIGPLAEDNSQGPYCIFCMGRPIAKGLTYTDEIEFGHERSCPIVSARKILAERGTPLNIYRIDGEWLMDKTWYEYHSWGLETLNQRAVTRYSGENKRNIIATFVGTLPLEDKTLEAITRDVQRVMEDRPATEVVTDLLARYNIGAIEQSVLPVESTPVSEEPTDIETVLEKRDWDNLYWEHTGKYEPPLGEEQDG